MTEVLEAEIIDSDYGFRPIADSRPQNSEIVPYRQSTIDGGFVSNAPVQSYTPQGSATTNLSNGLGGTNETLETATRVSSTGTREWLPTRAEEELVDAVTRNPYSGLDELADAGGHTARGIGGRGLGKATHAAPYVGDIIGGTIEGAIVYGQTGSIAHGLGAGIGATVGGIAGSSLGGIAGSVGGPVGAVGGSIAGGVVGGAIGSAVGQGIANFFFPLPPTNPNEVTETTYGNFDAKAGGDFSALGGARISGMRETNYKICSKYSYSHGSNWSSGKYLYDWYQFFDCDGNPDNLYSFWYYKTPKVDSVGGCIGESNPFDPDRYPSEEPYDPTKDPNAPKLRDPDPITLPGPTTRPKDKPTSKPFTDPDIPDLPNFPNIPGIPGFDNPVGDDDKDKPSGDKENPTSDPTDTDDSCNPCEKLDYIIDLLEPEFTSGFEVLDCESEEVTVINPPETAKGLLGLYNKIYDVFAYSGLIFEKVKCPVEPTLAVPDSWELKKELNTPQLVIVCKKPEDKTSYRRSFSIPHPSLTTEDEAKALFTYRMQYTRGKHLSMLNLRDNSSIRLYTLDKSEGHRIMNFIIDNLLDLSYKDEDIRDSENANRVNGESVVVEFYTISYYSKGKKGDLPDWIYTIPE